MMHVVEVPVFYQGGQEVEVSPAKDNAGLHGQHVVITISHQCLVEGDNYDVQTFTLRPSGKVTQHLIGIYNAALNCFELQDAKTGEPFQVCNQ